MTRLLGSPVNMPALYILDVEVVGPFHPRGANA